MRASVTLNKIEWFFAPIHRIKWWGSNQRRCSVSNGLYTASAPVADLTRGRSQSGCLNACVESSVSIPRTHRLWLILRGFEYLGFKYLC